MSYCSCTGHNGEIKFIIALLFTRFDQLGVPGRMKHLDKTLPGLENCNGCLRHIFSHPYANDHPQ